MVRLNGGSRSIRNTGGIFPLLKILYAGTTTDLTEAMIYRLLNKSFGKELKHIYWGFSQMGRKTKLKRTFYRTPQQTVQDIKVLILIKVLTVRKIK